MLVAIELTRAPATYNPRACDCDLCRKHGAAYVSDAQGSLVIRIKDARARGKYRQGSGKATSCFVGIVACWSQFATRAKGDSTRP